MLYNEFRIDNGDRVYVVEGFGDLRRLVSHLLNKITEKYRTVTFWNRAKKVVFARILSCLCMVLA